MMIEPRKVFGEATITLDTIFMYKFSSASEPRSPSEFPSREREMNLVLDGQVIDSEIQL